MKKGDAEFLVALIFDFLFFTALNIVLKEAANFTDFHIPVLQLLQLTNHVMLEFEMIYSYFPESKGSPWVR